MRRNAPLLALVSSVTQAGGHFFGTVLDQRAIWSLDPSRTIAAAGAHARAVAQTAIEMQVRPLARLSLPQRSVAAHQSSGAAFAVASQDQRRRVVELLARSFATA